MERSNLKPDTYYFDRKDEMYFYTPDAVGGFWYTTKEEMFEQHNGKDRIIRVSEILDY